MKIETGASESHPTPLALSHPDAPDPVTPRFPGASGPADAASQIGGVADYQGQQQQRGAEGIAAAASAMAAGQAADGSRREHYQQAMGPLGAPATDKMNLPVVPSAAVPAAASDGFPYSGDEPVPSAAGYEDPAYGT